MMDFLLVLLAVILLAFGFVLQKTFQRRADDPTESGINFSILSGVFSVVILALTNGRVVSFTWYSVIHAILKSACCLAYTIIGFKIMKDANVALYMLFLMSGGMLVPAVWGWLFLGEEPKGMHILGLIVILVSIIINNFSKEKPSAKVILMSCAVFILNGFVSVFSKLHQVNTTYPMVSTRDFAMLSSMASLLMSCMLKGIRLLKGSNNGKGKLRVQILPIMIALSYSIVSTISSILQLEGARKLPASMLYPMITGGSVVFTGTFALIFFREKLSARGWLSVALCCLGTCFFV